MKCIKCKGRGWVWVKYVIGFTEPLYGFGSSPVACGEPIYKRSKKPCKTCKGKGKLK